MKRFAAGAALVLVAAGAVSGCGSSEDHATKKEFCDAIKGVSTSQTFKDTQKALKKLDKVGTPKGIPADAQAGIDKIIKVIGGAKDEKDATAKLKEMAAKKDKKQEAAGTYIDKTCAPSTPDSTPSPSPSPTK